jgi:hypothetical protein
VQITLYDFQKDESKSFSSFKEASKAIGFTPSRVKNLFERKFDHIDSRFIIDGRDEILTTLKDLSTGKIYKTLNSKTLGLSAGFEPTRRDAIAFCTLKRNRAYMATIGGIKFKNLNTDPVKVQSYLDKYNTESRRANQRENRAKNIERDKKKNQEWKDRNRPHMRRYNNAYTLSRREKDISFKMRMNLRARLRMALIGETKSGSILDLMGCSMDFFRNHIESQFLEGMSWSNYAKVWNIDHIIPCSFFDLSIEDHQRMCCYYKNLRPLCKIENGKKLNHLPNNYRSFISNNLIEAALHPVTAYKLMLAGHANL